MAYKNITLLTKTTIITQIFKLVCNKLDITLEVLSNDEFIKSTDILVFDNDIFDKTNIIRYKSASSVVVVLAKQSLYEYESCKIIKKPFLPSDLQKSLSLIIQNDNNSEDNTKNEIIDDQINIKLDSNVDDLVDFIDSIDDINNEDYNEINISKNELSNGGVLDKEELGLLHEMINDSNDDIEVEPSNDWAELSDIIDKAIDDVQEYSFNESDSSTLILNEYSIDELKPLLNKFNQNIIDELSLGNEVNIKLLLKK